MVTGIILVEPLNGSESIAKVAPAIFHSAKSPKLHSIPDCSTCSKFVAPLAGRSSTLPIDPCTLARDPVSLFSPPFFYSLSFAFPPLCTVVRISARRQRNSLSVVFSARATPRVSPIRTIRYGAHRPTRALDDEESPFADLPRVHARVAKLHSFAFNFSSRVYTGDGRRKTFINVPRRRTSGRARFNAITSNQGTSVLFGTTRRLGSISK